MSWTPKNNFGDVLKKMEETRSIRHQTASSAVSFGSQDKGKQFKFKPSAGARPHVDSPRAQSFQPSYPSPQVRPPLKVAATVVTSTPIVPKSVRRAKRRSSEVDMPSCVSPKRARLSDLRSSLSLESSDPRRSPSATKANISSSDPPTQESSAHSQNLYSSFTALLELYQEQIKNYEYLLDLHSTIIPQAFGGDILVGKDRFYEARSHASDKITRGKEVIEAARSRSLATQIHTLPSTPKRPKNHSYHPLSSPSALRNSPRVQDYGNQHHPESPHWSPLKENLPLIRPSNLQIRPSVPGTPLREARTNIPTSSGDDEDEHLWDALGDLDPLDFSDSQLSGVHAVSSNSGNPSAMPFSVKDSFSGPLDVSPSATALELIERREPTEVLVRRVEKLDREAASSTHHHGLLRILRDTFKLHSLRLGQLAAVYATVTGRDVFVLMPTGGGKSLCYQLPALYQAGNTRGLTIVFSPLKALITDQVDKLKALGVDVVCYSGDQTTEENQAVDNRLRGSDIPTILFVTPEKLDVNSGTRHLLDRLNNSGRIARFVVDEAHVTSTWGQDFRPSYKNLDCLRIQWPKVPIMALTATANPRVVKDVVYGVLNMRDPVIIKTSSNRPNLHYAVLPKPRGTADAIIRWIVENHYGQAGIVYTLSRVKCEELADKLQAGGIKARHYHARISQSDKENVARGWQKGDIQVIVATIAFGMGIDKPDVRFVVHECLPKTFDGYVQETGRAGRDGKPADCLLYFSWKDLLTFEWMIDKPQEGAPELTEAQKTMQKAAVRAVARFAANREDCRRVLILDEFREMYAQPRCEVGCDNCDEHRTAELRDVTAEALQFLKFVKSVQGVDPRVTETTLVKAFKGHALKDIRAKGLDQLPLAGAGRDIDLSLLERLANYLSRVDALQPFEYTAPGNRFSNTYTKLGDKFEEYMAGEHKVILPIQARVLLNKKKPIEKPIKRTKTKPAAANKHAPLDPIDSRREEDEEADLAIATKVSATASVRQRVHKGMPGGELISFTDDEEEHPPAELIYSSDEEEAYVIPSWRAPSSLAAIDKSSSETEEPYQCFAKLKRCYEEFAAKHADLPDISDGFLWELALCPPADISAFKSLAKDHLDDHTSWEVVWRTCGKPLLNICVGFAQADTASLSPSKTMSSPVTYYKPPSTSSTTSHKPNFSTPAIKEIDRARFIHDPSLSSSTSSSSGVIRLRETVGANKPTSASKFKPIVR